MWIRQAPVYFDYEPLNAAIYDDEENYVFQSKTKLHAILAPSEVLLENSNDIKEYDVLESIVILPIFIIILLFFLCIFNYFSC